MTPVRARFGIAGELVCGRRLGVVEPRQARASCKSWDPAHLYAPRTGPIGRQAERSRVEKMLDSLHSGPAGLALEGAAGIGKTTVWRDGVASADDRGYRVLATAPAERDSELAFTGLGDLFDALPPEALATLSRPQRGALESALFVEDATGAPGDPQALPRATIRVLRALAADRPVLVAIDDEQWLDRPTARALAFALTRLRDEHVGVLITRRPRSAGTLWPELARGSAPSGLPSLPLEPLELGRIGELLARELGHTMPRPRLRRIYDVS